MVSSYFRCCPSASIAFFFRMECCRARYLHRSPPAYMISTCAMRCERRGGSFGRTSETTAPTSDRPCSEAPAAWLLVFGCRAGHPTTEPSEDRRCDRRFAGSQGAHFRARCLMPITLLRDPLDRQARAKFAADRPTSAGVNTRRRGRAAPRRDGTRRGDVCRVKMLPVRQQERVPCRGRYARRDTARRDRSVHAGARATAHRQLTWGRSSLRA